MGDAFFLKRAGKGLVSLSLSLFRGRRMEIEVLFQKIKDTGKKNQPFAPQLSFLFSSSFLLQTQRQNKTTMPLQISSLSADFKTRASSPYIVFECEGVRAQTKAIKVERLRNSLWSFSFFCFFRGRRRRRVGERASGGKLFSSRRAARAALRARRPLSGAHSVPKLPARLVFGGREARRSARREKKKK